jgi:hypothetical protein
MTLLLLLYDMQHPTIRYPTAPLIAAKQNIKGKWKQNYYPMELCMFWVLIIVI